MNRMTRTALIASASLLAGTVSAHAQTIDFTKGFPSNAALSVNQTQNLGNEWVALPGDCLVLAPGYAGAFAPDQAISAYSVRPVDVRSFKTTFTFRLQGDMGQFGSGLTFTIQNAPEGKAAIGKSAGGLGYAGIAKSVAIKFDNEQDGKDPSANTIGLYVKGEFPTGGTDLTPTGIDLQSGHLMQATIVYIDKIVYVYLNDLETGAYAEQKYEVDIPAVVGSNTAFVGFTGSTDNFGTKDLVFDWYFNSVGSTAGLSVDQYLVPGGTLGNGTVTLSSPAVVDTPVKLISSNPAAYVPDVVYIKAGQTSADFPIKTVPVKDLTVGQVKAYVNGKTLSANYSVRPVQLVGATIKNNFVAEGAKSEMVLTLEAPAAPGPVVVNLSSTNPSAAWAPSSVIFPAGSVSVTVPVYTGGVDANSSVLISAATGGARQTGSITVRPLRPTNLYLSLSSVKGGTSLQGKVQLEAPAPKGGRVVTLGSANTAVASVPATVTIPEGWTTQVFSITTSSVKTNTSVKLSATVGTATVYSSLGVTVK